jgi:DNA-directed RNA polymerase subunit RPC12/RpoP
MEKIQAHKECFKKVARGLVFYKCANCKEHCANYTNGQQFLCHPCCEKLHVCVICGKPLKEEDKAIIDI